MQNESICPQCGATMQVTVKKESTDYTCSKCGHKVVDLEMDYD